MPLPKMPSDEDNIGVGGQAAITTFYCRSCKLRLMCDEMAKLHNEIKHEGNRVVRGIQMNNYRPLTVYHALVPRVDQRPDHRARLVAIYLSGACL